MDKKHCTNNYFWNEELNVLKYDQVNVPKVHEEIRTNINQDVSNIFKDEGSEINEKVLSEVNLEVNLKIRKEVKGSAGAHFQRPKIPKPFPCSLCALAFNRRLFLTKHMQLFHQL